MKSHTFIYIITVALLAVSCGSGRKLVQEQQTASRYFYEKQYDSAATAYENIIAKYEAKNISAPAEVYASAGKSLYYSGREKDGVDLLYKAECMGYDDELSLIMKIKYYHKIDNHSKELNNLEKYQQMYRNGDEIQYVSIRLLKRYMQMNEYQKAQRHTNRSKTPRRRK